MLEIAEKTKTTEFQAADNQSGKPVGLLVNFNVPVLKKGLKGIVNHYAEPEPRTSPQSLSPSPRLGVSAVNQ